MTIRCAYRAFLALASLAVLGCGPDRATAPNDRLSQPKGPAANIENLPTTAPILYDQRSSLSGSLAVPTGDDGVDNRYHVGDDFVVPAGETWTVTQVVFSGLLRRVATLPFAIRADNNGVPGAVIRSFSLAPTASDPNACGCGPFFGIAEFHQDLLFTLPTSVTVMPGTYWLTVGPTNTTVDVVPQAHAPIVGSAPLGSDDDGGSWSRISSTRDAAFVLFGTGGRQEQTITFPAITPNPATVGGTATPGAIASSGLAVSYTSLTTDVCTVSASTLTSIAAGTCTVAADQSGNGTFRPAPRATQDITVNKATQTITFPAITPNPATIGGSATLGATAFSGLAVTYTSQSENVCTVSGNTVSFIAAGTCTVAANQAGSASYFAAAEATQNVSVVKIAQAITLTSTPPSPGYVNGTYTVGATGGASGNAVVITVGPPNVCAVSANLVRFVGVGTCTIAANQSGNNAYEAAAQVSQSVKVDYQYNGFLDPVKNGGVLNVAKAGQVIPLKWRLTDATGAAVTTLSTAAVTARELSCTLAGSSTDQVEEGASGTSGLQNLGDGYYQLNWKAPANYANSCKTLHLDLGEGSGARTARFAFTK